MKIRLQLWIVFCAIFLTACSGNIQYRTDLEKICTFTKEGDCATSILYEYKADPASAYMLGFIEFDEQGQLWKREQMYRVSDEFNKIAGRNDVLIVVFVHGWKHNAKAGDSNISEFRKALQKLSKTESLNSKKFGFTKRKILGLYLGWRGESINVDYLNNITFWDRKNTAHKVGQRGVTEPLLKMEEIINVKQGIADRDKKPSVSHLIIVGHSFGGAVVFASLQQVLNDRYLDSHSGKTYQDGPTGFGDLVVLVNPAFEAMRYATLYDISQQYCRRYPGQMPTLVTLTSEADWATKYTFPLGRFFSTLFETHSSLKRNYCTEQGKKPFDLDEEEADRNTIGHFEPFITHKLLPNSGAGKDLSRFSYRALRSNWLAQKPENTLYFTSTHLVHLGKTRPRNPFLNIQVSKQLIPDHNNIWGDDIVQFISDMIVMSTIPVSSNIPVKH